MTVERFANEFGFDILCMPAPEKEISGAYIGDLLSWVMGKAEQSHVWLTIMSNINTVAVATLADTSCILLCEDVRADGELLRTASEKGVNILSTDLTSFEAAVKIKDAVR